jgi:fructose-1,6-bisphosphatase/inositol monophosphatase family enzyme
MVTEAGGQVVQLDGAPLEPFDDLQSRTTLVAAATPELSKEIINAIVV